MQRKRSAGLLLCLLVVVPAFAQNRRVYEGVASLKLKTIGTVILLEVHGDQVSGWIRLIHFIPIDGGTVGDKSSDFRAAGNTYHIDERKGRISYSGPDGDGERLVTPLVGVTGKFDELIEGQRFSGGANFANIDVDGRMRRFDVEEPSLWKRQGPPFEKFNRVEELLQRTITVWVPDPDHGEISVIEEPEGMDIPLKAPKKPKAKK